MISSLVMIKIAFFIISMVAPVHSIHESRLNVRFQCHSALQYTAKIRFKITFAAKITSCSYYTWASYRYDISHFTYRCILPGDWMLVNEGYEEQFADTDQPNCDIIQTDDYHFNSVPKNFVIDNFPTTFATLSSPKEFNGNGISLVGRGDNDDTYYMAWILTKEGSEYYEGGHSYQKFSFLVDRCTCKDVPLGYEVLHFKAPASEFGVTQEKSICSAGKKNTRTDVASICEECESGKFQDEEGKTFCYDCDEATDRQFSYFTKLYTISQNKPGSCTFSTGATSFHQCNYCEKGYYCAEITDASKCTLTETELDGVNVEVRHNCERCQNDWTTPGIGVYTSSQCEGECLEGSYRDLNNECIFCNFGQCADSINKECIRCPPGSKTDIRMNCLLGAVNEHHCTSCEFGKYQSFQGQIDCFDCGKGTYSNASTCWNHINTAELDDYKKSCDENLQECDTYKCRENRESCEICPLGSYSDQEGSTSCTYCGIGETSIDNEKRWVNGELERTNQISRPYACVSCPAGTKSSGGDCVKCEAHHYSEEKAEFCLACPVGKTHNAEHTACIHCSQYYLRSTELSNFEHSYPDGHGCLGCYDVKGGNHVIDISPRLVDQNATCARCESGFYNKVSNAEACNACPPCPEQFYRTGCGVGKSTSTGSCKSCAECSDDEIRIDCKNREGHNDEKGYCEKKERLTRTPECPRMNANTFTWQTIGLGGYGYTEVFGVNENQTYFQCRQPCDSTTAVVNAEDVSKDRPYLYNKSNYGVVDSGYCTQAYACNTVSCLTETENRQVMACPEKIETGDDVTAILHKRDDFACVSCESCEGRGCVDCAQLMCDNGEVWDWTEEDLAFRCKTCSALRNTGLCLNSDLQDFKSEHWPSGLIPVVKFAGCVGKNEQSLRDMTYGRCEKIDDVLTQTCAQPEQFYSRSEGKCIPCLPRNTRMQEFVYLNSSGNEHRTYCQITGCKEPDVTGVSKWGMLCTEQCSEKTCQDFEQLVSCVVPHDTRCVSTHMPGNHRVGVSNLKRDFVPVHANLLEPIRVDEDTDFYFSSSFENHLITLDDYAENEFQCVWNARNIQDLNEIPGGNSRTFLAKSDVTDFDRYDREGTKKCRKWPAKGPYPMLPLQNSVRDVHSDHGLFLLNSSASIMSYRYEDEDGLFSTLKETKKKFSAHRLTGDLFLNIDMNGESQVNFMSFARPTNDSWVNKWEVSLLARDSSAPFHGDFLLQISLPTLKGDAIRAIQPRLLDTINPNMKHIYISRLFCKNSNRNFCFSHTITPDFSGAETALKSYLLLREHPYVVLKEYSAPSVQNFAPCDNEMQLFKHSSLQHLQSSTSMIAKRNIAPTLTSDVLIGLVSDVNDFAACTANDVKVQCFRACMDSETYEWTKDNAEIIDLSSDSGYLLVSTVDLNQIEYQYYLINVDTGTENSLGIQPNFKVFLSGPDSVWLLLRDFDTAEMSLQQFDLVASEDGVQVLSTDNVIDLEWKVANTKFLSAKSTLISKHQSTWLIMAPYSTDEEFAASLSIRVQQQDTPLLKLDKNLEEGNIWNFAKIQQRRSFLSHAWIGGSKVAVGYDEQVFILEFDSVEISFQMASESNLQRHHFVAFRDGLITQEFQSSSSRNQHVQNCLMGYVQPNSNKYKQIGENFESDDYYCYHKCNAHVSCDGIRLFISGNSTFCALYEPHSQSIYTDDTPSCIRDHTYLRRFTLEFEQTQIEFETFVSAYDSEATTSSGVFITSILHAAANLSSRGSKSDGYFAYDLRVFTHGEPLDDLQLSSYKDYVSTETLVTQYFPMLNTVDGQSKAVRDFPYVHSQIDSDEIGFVSYSNPSHETAEFNKDLFLEIRIHTMERDPWLAIIRFNCTEDALVYVQNRMFESMASCESDYAYLIVYYKDGMMMFDYHSVQAFDARRSMTYTDNYARVLLNFRTSLVFLQRMPHVPADVFKNPEMFLTKQTHATALQQDWQLFRRTTSVKPDNVSVSLFNFQRRQGTVAIDNMQVVPLLNVGIKSFEQIGDTRIQETEFYIPSLSELKELALESVVSGDNLENWERIHVNFRVQTDTPGCEVEMRVLHVARDAEYHIGCKATADAHNETMCSVEVPTYFAENQDKQLPYVRTHASCEMQAVTVFFNPLSPMSTCTNLNQYYDYDRDLCVGCEYRVKICPLGMFMPGCDAFGHTAECQNCSGVLGSNEEFVQGDLVCQRRCVANYYRFEGECVPCGETLKNSCNATHRWQACTETEDEKCVECDPIIKSVFGGNEEYVQSDQGECVTRCKEGHWRDLSEPPFFCRRCKTTEEVLNGRDISEFRIQNCTAFSDTLAVGCTEENDQTCGLPSSVLQHDACGICGGDNSTCMDCKGMIHGSSEEDSCGVCDGKDLCVDCSGIPHGGAVEDACGECGGDNTTCMDKCGVINGNNSCLVEYVDACGVLNGDNSTCMGCDGNLYVDTPVKDIQCHTCGGDMITICECDHERCAEPDAMFDRCPLFTVCPIEPCSNVQECRICEPDKRYDRYKKSCELCEAGKYTDTNGCSQCPHGKYSQQEGVFECTDCPDNSLHNPYRTQCICLSGYDTTDDGCEPCAVGKYSEFDDYQVTQCKICEENYYCVNGHRFVCPDGMMSDEGSDSQDDCQCKEGFGYRDLSCQQCNKGWYSDKAGEFSCVQCPPGKYSTQSQSDHESLCIPCHQGAYSKQVDVGYNEAIDFDVACGHCEVGKVVNRDIQQPVSVAEESQICKQCEGGTMNIVMEHFDHDNDSNTETIVMHNQTCFPCPAGTHFGDGHDHSHHSTHESGCYYCNSHTYSVLPEDVTLGPTHCTNCPENSGNTVLNDIDLLDAKIHCKCNAGYERTIHDDPWCMQCNPGYAKSIHSWNPSQINIDDLCVICPAGKISDESRINCVNCPAAKYTASDGSGQCLDCGEGQYAPVGSTQCYDCGAGQEPNSALTACVDCTVGKFSAGNGYCIGCENGKYAGSGASTCSECSAGEEINQYASGCVQCEAGKFSASAGDACSQCAAGKYSTTGATMCTSCPAGTTSPAGSTAASECESCAAGKYAASAGSDCINCPVGKYNFISKQTCAGSCYLVCSFINYQWGCSANRGCGGSRSCQVNAISSDACWSSYNEASGTVCTGQSTCASIYEPCRPSNSGRGCSTNNGPRDCTTTISSLSTITLSWSSWNNQMSAGSYVSVATGGTSTQYDHTSSRPGDLTSIAQSDGIHSIDVHQYQIDSGYIGYNAAWNVDDKLTSCASCPAGKTSPEGSDSESDCVAP